MLMFGRLCFIGSPSPSILRAVQHISGLGLQQGNHIARFEERFIFEAFGFAQSALIALLGERVNVLLRGFVGSKVDKSFRLISSEALTNRLEEAIENCTWLIHAGIIPRDDARTGRGGESDHPLPSHHLVDPHVSLSTAIG